MGKDHKMDAIRIIKETTSQMSKDDKEKFNEIMEAELPNFLDECLKQLEALNFHQAPNSIKSEYRKALHELGPNASLANTQALLNACVWVKGNEMKQPNIERNPNCKRFLMPLDFTLSEQAVDVLYELLQKLESETEEN